MIDPYTDPILWLVLIIGAAAAGGFAADAYMRSREFDEGDEDENS